MNKSEYVKQAFARGAQLAAQIDLALKGNHVHDVVSALALHLSHTIDTHAKPDTDPDQILDTFTALVKSTVVTKAKKHASAGGASKKHALHRAAERVTTTAVRQMTLDMLTQVEGKPTENVMVAVGAAAGLLLAANFGGGDRKQLEELFETLCSSIEVYSGLISPEEGIERAQSRIDRRAAEREAESAQKH